MTLSRVDFGFLGEFVSPSPETQELLTKATNNMAINKGKFLMIFYFLSLCGQLIGLYYSSIARENKLIRFEQVHKWFGNLHVLKGIDLHVRKGTLFVLCGDNGAGKTTLLSAVNGLESIDKGSIFVDGVTLSAHSRNLPALRRQIGVVYQGYNLFSHMTAEQNIRIGLEKSLRLGKKESIWRTDQYLERVGIIDKKEAYPVELSGGQKQRVAIARCLAMRPKIILMDEPTSALDGDNSNEIVDIIRSLKEEGITILIVTHQLGIFEEITDDFACVEFGQITECGTREDAEPEKGWGSKVASWLSRSSFEER